jgi:hypothetical protein
MWQGHAHRASATGAHPSDGLVCCASAARARALGVSCLCEAGLVLCLARGLLGACVAL